MSRDEAKSKLGGLGVEVWLTRPDWSALCAKQSGYLPGDASVRSGATSKMNPAQTHQIMDGFGSALTGSSADLIAQLAPPTRDALLRELFPAGIGGIGMSCLRISIGASDLSSATLRKSAPRRHSWWLRVLTGEDALAAEYSKVHARTWPTS